MVLAYLPPMPSRRASGIDTMSRRRLSLAVAPSIPRAGAFRRATSKGWCSTVCARSSRLERTSVTLSRRSALTPRPNEMLCWAAGGPQKYTGRAMKESHQHLMIAAAEWEAFLDDLQQTLDKFAVPEAEQAEIKAIIGSTRTDIVV